MPKQLGTRDTTGVAEPALDSRGDNPFGNGFWVARFYPAQLPRVPCQIASIAISGPPGSQVRVFVDSRFATGTSRASLNQWGGETIDVDPGQTVIFYWNTAAAPAPKATIWLQEHEE